MNFKLIGTDKHEKLINLDKILYIEKLDSRLNDTKYNYLVRFQETSFKITQEEYDNIKSYVFLTGL